MSDHYCADCGIKLESPSRSAVTAVPATSERRQLTVMFCDLVGSTALAVQRDPEDARHIMRLYQELCASVIRAYEGCIAQTLGDGLLVYFGHPTAHEDDAVRAIFAALQITAAVKDSRGALRQAWPGCAVRIGISTGLVVIGQFSSWDTRANMASVGEPPNVAARLQQLAGRNEVVVETETKQLAEGFFRFEELGPQQLKGMPGPQSVWLVRAKPVPPTRFQAQHSSKTRVTVGRELELSSLNDCWRRTCANEPQVVIVHGPAGIGKSHLAHAFVESRAAPRGFLLHYQCSPYFRNTALYPVVIQMRRAAALRPEEPGVTQLAKARRLLNRGDECTQEEGVLLARLLGLDEATQELGHESAPEDILNAMLEMLTRKVLQLSRKRPILILIEDAHWMDPTTLRLVQACARATSSRPVMLLITSRDAPAGAAFAPREARIELARLPGEACHALLASLGAAGVTSTLVERIVSFSDGIPLYVEELLKTVLARPVEERLAAVPTSLQASLTERLDRAGDLKTVAQAAACIGRSFDARLLCAVLDQEYAELHCALQRLVESELLVEDDRAEEFEFRHALLQAAAQDSMLLTERRAIHAKVARYLQRARPALCEKEPETVARHLMAAGQLEQATPYWLRAAEDAQQRSAHVEAIGHARAGLECIHARQGAMDAEELELQTTLARSHMAAEGWPGMRVRAAYERARALSDKLGRAHNESALMWGLWAHHATRGELTHARGIAEDWLQQDGTADGRRGTLLLAHAAAQLTLFALGHFAAAQAHADIIEQEYRVDEHGTLARAYNHDPLAMSRAYQAYGLWVQGHPGRARRAGALTLEHARVLDHPFQLCHALIHCSGAPWRSAQSACAINDEGLTLAIKHKIPFFLAYAPLHAAEDRFKRNPARETLQHFHECLKRVRANAGHHSLHLPLFTLRVALAHEHAGDLDMAEQLLRESSAAIALSGERWIAPEVSRCHARLIRQRGDLDRAEDALRSALSLARELHAPGFELRAALDLAALSISVGDQRGAVEAVRGVSMTLEEGDADHERALRLLAAS